MKIGIDISPLQTASRMRGIGYALTHTLNNMSPENKSKHSFVFYMDKTGDFDPFELINVSGLDYTTEYLNKFKSYRRLPWKFRILSRVINKTRVAFHQWVGDERFKTVKDIDLFFQIDIAAGLPRKRRVKSVLVLLDIVPYIMEDDYLLPYRTARQRGLKRRGALVSHLARKTYAIKTRVALKRAAHFIAISEWTKKDFVEVFNVKKDNVSVIPLGVDEFTDKKRDFGNLSFSQAIPNFWGYSVAPVDLTSKPFLLFVGGADPRRKLVDLVAAFNNLRAQGKDMRLVFAGDSMSSPTVVANPKLQKYLEHNTAYMDDIAFLGFVNDEQRDWLYLHALTFVFPSVYEGFGLPVLEAMVKGCPVVTYKNTSIEEIIGNGALVAKDFDSIAKHVKELLDKKGFREKTIEAGYKQAAKFSWSKTSDDIFEDISSIYSS